MKGSIPCFHINDSVYHSFNCILMDSVNFNNAKDQHYATIQDGKIMNT